MLIVRHRAILPFIAVVWILGVGIGVHILGSYESTPGIAATPPVDWPAKSEIVRASDRPTLVMMLHPNCPCSQATLEELDRLMARGPDRLAARVVFVVPRGLAGDPAATGLWQRAAAIRGVTMMRDEGGIEAQRFNALTSGQTVLYDAAGRLLFSGGITASRGHAGDNAGLTALIALLTHDDAPRRSTPVFGCSLLGTDRPHAVL